MLIVTQIINRFGYSLFGKAKKWFNQGRVGRPHATVADWNALNRWLVGEISNGMVMKLLINVHTELPNWERH